MKHLLSFPSAQGVRKAVLPVFVGLWLAALVPGVRYLMAYEGTAGAQGVAPLGWPDGVPPMGDAGTPTLVVALHPRCSCSAATLKELESAAESTDRHFQTILYVYQPENADAEWQNKSMYREVVDRLHATVVPDVNGRYASRFGALTSGAVLYFSAARESGKRELLFSGGVTAARGMVGDNAGVEELKAALYSDRAAGDGKTPVFGCGLFGKHFIETGTGL